MPKRKATLLHPLKFSQPERIRLNLMMASVYLAAFEMLKLSIVDGVESHFMQGMEYDEGELEELAELEKKEADLARELGTDYGPGPLTRYRELVASYEKEVDVRYSFSDAAKLVPSAKWLLAGGVLSEDDLPLVSAIRDHRNQLAHELPSLLLGEAMEVDFDMFAALRSLLRKVDLHWFRSDIALDPRTWTEIDTTGIPDDEIYSGREAMLQIIISALTEYVNSLATPPPPAAPTPQ